MILIIDNYDSFTYNLAQALGELGCRVEVVRNDAVDLEAVHRLAPRALVISPGPGRPSRAGITPALIRHFARRMPILGVCLGHQAIAEAFGARVERASQPVHGKTSAIYHDGKGIFKGLRNPFTACRYHSLVVPEHTVRPPLSVSAYTQEGEVMGLSSRELKLDGVQFHPESIATGLGMKLLRNFLELHHLRQRRPGPEGPGCGKFLPSGITMR